MQTVGKLERFLASLLVMAGGMGVLLGIVVMGVSGIAEPGGMLFGLLATGASALLVGAGVLLWRGHRLGRPMALVLFITQVPIIETPAFAAYWYSGLSLGPMVVWLESAWQTTLTFSVGVGGTLEWNRAGDQTALGINLVALLAAIALWKRKNPGQSALSASALPSVD